MSSVLKDSQLNADDTSLYRMLIVYLVLKWMICLNLLLLNNLHTVDRVQYKSFIYQLQQLWVTGSN